MPLNECMQKVTYREYLTWQAWLDDEWNRPSRSDKYLMQITLYLWRVLHLFAKNIPTEPTLKELEIKFEKVKPKKEPTKEEIKEKEQRELSWAKAKWAGFLNYSLGKKKSK